MAVLTLLTAGGCTQASGDVAADREAAKEIREKLLATSAAAEKTADAAEAGPTGYASLKGQFVWSGPPVQLKLLDANIKPEERAVCAPGGRMPRENDLRVDSATHGIADVLIFARDVKHVHDSARQPQTAEVVFDQKECMFLSPVFVAQVGQIIQVKNSDPVGHNTNIPGAGFNPSISPNQAELLKVKSQVETPLDVSCSIHPWMKAYILFRRDGYFAKTGKDGTFVIENLPTGEELEFQVWHARARRGLALKVPELKWNSRGRFRVTLKPDVPMDLGKLEVPAAALAGS